MADPVKMEVTRAFWLEGRVLAVGETFVCEPRFARELQANGKATPAIEKPKPKKAD